MDYAIEIQDLCKTIDEQNILSNVNMRVKNHVISIVIANVTIILLGMLFTFMLSIGEIPQNSATSDFTTMGIISMLITATFLVWEAVLIALIIVEEFRSKTISLLFTYPINRKKLIAAKLTLILVVTFISIAASEVFQNVCVFGLSKVFSFIIYEITLKDVLHTLIITISALLLGMLPLYVGMIRKSTIATIISSLFIVSIAVNSQTAVGGIITIIPIAIVLGSIGLLFATIAIKKIVVNDLD